MSQLGHDLALGFKSLARSPLFAASAALILSLGIGSSSALFSIIKSVLLDPPPYPEAHRLVSFWAEGDWSLEEFAFARERVRSFEWLAAVDAAQEVALGSADGARLLRAGYATSDYFRMLRATALIGRLPTEADCAPGAEGGVILSHGLWQRQFAGSSAVTGDTVLLDEIPTVVLGVMPRGFTDPAGRPDLWLCARLDPTDDRYANDHSYRLLGRLGPDATLESAQSEVRELGAQLGAEFDYPPEYDKSKVPLVVGLHERLAGGLRTPLAVLLVASGLVLAIACANVASLQLARSLSRRKELSVRSALGATRARLAREVLIESLTLAALGSALGAAIAAGLVRLAPSLAPANQELLRHLGLDPMALFAAIALSVVTVAAFGAVPSSAAARLISPSRRSAGDTPAQQRWRSAFVVIQTSLVVVLLFGSFSTARELLDLYRVQLGFDPDDVTAVRLPLPRGLDRGERISLMQRVEDRLGTLAAIDRVGSIQRPPLQDGWIMSLLIEGRSGGNDEAEPTVYWRVVTPGYLDAVDLAVLSGRQLSSADDRDAPRVVLVNRELARRFFPDRDPIGRSVRVAMIDEFATIVGVVEDERLLGPGSASLPVLYQPFSQAPLSSMTVMLESSSSADELAPMVRLTLAEVDPRIPVAEIESMRQQVSRSVRGPRSLAALLAILALAGLVLGASGLLGVLSYNVAQRAREIAVRMAIGADWGAVVGLVARQAAVLTLAGLLAGAAFALVVTEAMSASLTEIPRPSPIEALLVVIVLAVVAAAAAIIPAARALHVDPNRTLRA